MTEQQPMTEVSRRRVLLSAGGTVAAMVLTACSSSKQAPTAPTPPASPSASPTASASASPSTSATASGYTSATAITIKNFTFTPSTLTVAPGTRITVTNQDTVEHTLTATAANTFDTGTLASGKSAVITAPSKPGDYPFSCTIHPFMKGTLTVR